MRKRHSKRNLSIFDQSGFCFIQFKYLRLFFTAVIAFSYLMMSILSVFYAYNMGFAIMKKIPPNAVSIPSLSFTLYYSTKFISKVTLINIRYDMRSDLEIHCYNIFFQVLTNFKNQSISTFVLYKVKLVVNSRQTEFLAISY